MIVEICWKRGRCIGGDICHLSDKFVKIGNELAARTMPAKIFRFHEIARSITRARGKLQRPGKKLY